MDITSEFDLSEKRQQNPSGGRTGAWDNHQGSQAQGYGAENNNLCLLRTWARRFRR